MHEVPCQGGGILGSRFDPLRIEGDPAARRYRAELLQPVADLVGPRLDQRRTYNTAMLTDDDKQWISAQISSAIAASEERLGARIEKIETSLLTEFHKWASPVATRLRAHSSALRTMDLEMEALPDRMDRLESSGRSAD